MHLVVRSLRSLIDTILLPYCYDRRGNAVRANLGKFESFRESF